MKFRADFVTNSSSSSFLTFSINNPELYQLLISLGIKILNTEENTFSDGMKVVLPSGEALELYLEDADWMPTCDECTSITSWLMSIILNEIESLYPPKELDEYSEFTIALLQLLKEKELLDINIEDSDSWDREMLEESFKKFDKMDKTINNAEIEFNTGFEGEICHMEYITSKNGYCLTITTGDDCEEEENDLIGLNIVIIGKEDEFEDKDALIEFIEENGGEYKLQLRPNTDYVICNNLNKKDTRLQKAKDLCIPIISEKGFLYRFGEENVFDTEEDLYNELFACTYEGEFYNMFHQYGIGNVTRKKLN